MLGTTGNTAYNMTKEAVRALSRTAANEWGQHGINVNVISPTLRTDAFEAWEDARPEFVKALRESLPMRRLGDPVGRVSLESVESVFTFGFALAAEGRAPSQRRGADAPLRDRVRPART
jgi:NAD(P)-dependent dehydrogenase (short-subunit alcohol dehydrogenase family)